MIMTSLDPASPYCRCRQESEPVLLVAGSDIHDGHTRAATVDMEHGRTVLAGVVNVGRGRIAALVLFSVSVALSIAVWLPISYTIPAYGNPYERIGMASLALHLMAILALSAAAVILSLWLMRRTLPARVAQPRVASHSGQKDPPISPV
jgi:hypothetical protein